MSVLIQDLQYGIRLLGKHRAVSLVAILSIALGLGVNATVLSWVDSILLHAMRGVADQSQVMVIKSVTPEGDTIDSSYPDYQDLRDRSTLFSGIIATKMRPLAMGEAPNAERVWAETVSGNYFDVLGVRPLLGRTFNLEEQDERIGAHPVAVLSERLWRRSFASDPSIVGRTVNLNHHTFTVIGVVPAEFRGTATAINFDLFVPLTMRPQLEASGNWLPARGSRPLWLFGRLKQGVTAAQAQAELSAIAERLAETYPNTNRSIGVQVVPLWKSPDGAIKVLRLLLQVLLAIGAVVLLIVCSNVGNLLLARATARRKEFAIRMGLGAGRRRLLRQLLTESFVLASCGVVLGLLVAGWLAGSLDAFLPATDLPVGLNPHISGTVITLTIVLGFFTALLCGVAPALFATRSDINEMLKSGGRGTSSSPHSNQFRGALVVAEVALAVVALVGAGLFVQSFQNAKSAKLGFEPEGVLLAGLDLATNGYSREQNLLLIRRAQQALENKPGIRSFTISEDVPLGFGGRSWEDIEVEGHLPRAGENMKVWRNVIGPRYFETLQLPLLEGRDFTWQDSRATAPVVIVNQTFVRRFLAGRRPLGHKVRAFGRDMQIVGVAKDSKYLSLSEAPIPYFYVPLEQVYNSSMGLAVQVRTEGPPSRLSAVLRRELQALDPGISISVLFPLSEYLSASYFAQKVGAALLTVLGGISLLLAALGLYGVMAYSVGQRTHEIGIRMALGARPSDVLTNVMGRGLVLALVGIAAGAAISLAVSRAASGLLFEVSSTDPRTFAGVALFLSLTALLACYWPALRATRIDPSRALQDE